MCAFCTNLSSQRWYAMAELLWCQTLLVAKGSEVHAVQLHAKLCKAMPGQGLVPYRRVALLPSHGQMLFNCMPALHRFVRATSLHYGRAALHPAGLPA